MTNEEKSFIHLDGCIKEYRQMHPMNGERLNYLLQQISGTLYYLEDVRSEVHNNYQIKIEELVGEGNSVARAIVKADIEFPLMYKIRHRMKGAYVAIDSIRSNISWLKSEKQNTRGQI